eukprot:5058697-Pleurochrysis_carterae.AAC.4
MSGRADSLCYYTDKLLCSTTPLTCFEACFSWRSSLTPTKGKTDVVEPEAVQVLSVQQQTSKQFFRDAVVLTSSS